jgi:AcrR family transcriptional regulator
MASSPHTPRQAEIVRVATALFAEHGYRGVGMRSIADAVGIRTSSLYHHFPAKEELLFAISLNVTRDFIVGNVALLNGPGAPEQRLAALIRRHVAYFVEHRLEQTVSRREMRELSPEHLQEVLDHERRYQARVEELVTAAVRSGSFDVPDVKVATLAVLDMVNGIGGWFRDDGRLSVSDLAELYVSMVLEVLGARRDPQARVA